MLNPILSLGIVILVGYLVGRLLGKMGLPAVTGYIVAGILIGPYGLKLIHQDVLKASNFVSSVALSFIAYNLGKTFTARQMRKIGKSVLAISIGEVLGSFLIVTLAIYFITRQPLYVAIVIGSIAPATAPAAVMMVVRELRAKGEFTDTLLGVVAIDDAWGIMLFALAIAVAESLSLYRGIVLSGIIHHLAHGIVEVGGSLLLGLASGFLLFYFFKFLKAPSHILIVIVGSILLTAGLSAEFGLSLLLSNMMLGATIANLLKPNTRAFEVLTGFDAPLYLLFFVLAGASLEFTNLKALGLVGLVYVLTRLPGEMLGAFIGAIISGAGKKVKKYLGLGLAPQAGVAIGLAIIAKVYLPEGDLILSTIILTTVVYELLGPPLVKIALKKAGEVYRE